MTRQTTKARGAGPAASSGPVVSMIVIETWIGVLEDLVPDPVGLAVRAGLDRGHLGSPDLFVPRDVELQLVELAVRHRGPEVGLLAAQRTVKGTFGLLEYLVRTSPTLALALDHLSRFGALLGSPPAIVRPGHPRASIEFKRRSPASGVVEDCIAEFALGALVWLGRGATEQAWHPEAVHFEHRPISSRARYQAVFRCPLEFGAQTTGMSVSAQDLALPMREADRRLHRILRDAAALFGVHANGGTGRFADRVEVTIADALRAARRIDLPGLAASLEMSARAVQHRLRREGASFRSVLERAREKVARRLLATTDLSVPQVAHVLGYSEPAPFHRAFRRWTGLTPTQYRARLPHR